MTSVPVQEKKFRIVRGCTGKAAAEYEVTGLPKNFYGGSDFLINERTANRASEILCKVCKQNCFTSFEANLS